MNGRSAYIFFTKPRFDVDDWRSIFRSFEQPDFAVELSHDALEVGAWARFLHPSDVPTTGFDEALISAFTKARASRGLLIRKQEIEEIFLAKLEASLRRKLLLRSYIYIAEFGAVMLLTVISPKEDSNQKIPLLPLDVRNCFANTTIPETSNHISQIASGSILANLGIKVTLDFTNSSSYQLAIFDADRGNVTEEAKLHHFLEDGDVVDASERLKLGGIGCTEAYVGNGNTTISVNHDWSFVFLIPVFLSIDGLYSVSTMMFDDAYDEFSDPPRDKKLSAISTKIERQERLLARSERLSLFRQKYEAMFKPWQSSIYKELYSKWRMDGTIEVFQKTIQLRLDELKSAQEEARLRLEQRQNGVLMLIAALEIVGLLGALVSYIELQCSIENNEIADPSLTFVASHSLLGVCTLILVSLSAYFIWRR